MILTPFNFELFEFNKMLFVYLITTIVLGSWLTGAIISKSFVFKRSFWDIPLILFLLSQTISYAFSIDRHTSLWGYYSRFNGGLISLFAYAALYWSFVTHMDSKSAKKSISIMVISSVLVSAYGILEHFGVDAHLWVQDVQNRVFSTLGQPNWLAAYLVALIPFATAYAIRGSLLYSFAAAILYVCLTFTKSRSGFVGLATSIPIVWGIAYLKDKPKTVKPLAAIATTIIVIAILLGTPWTRAINKSKQSVQPELPTENSAEAPLLISESGDIRKVIWKGAVEIWKNNPVFGTGPETFAYSYYWYRPREHNDLSEWDFLYNKAHNEYLNYAATTGTFGILAYLALIAVFCFWAIKKLRRKLPRQLLLAAAFSGFVSICVTNFFGFSVVIISTLFFLLPAIAYALANNKKALVVNLGQKTTYVLAAVITLFSAIALSTIYHFWTADYYFARGEKLNKIGEYDIAYNNLTKAISQKPDEPMYHNEISFSAASLAVMTYEQKDSTGSAKMSNVAINESNTALATSPYNLNFWKNRIKVLYLLAQVDDKYLQDTLDALAQARKIAPTDAKIAYNFGLIQASMGKQENAIKTMEETIALKPNYEEAHYALGLFYEQTGQKQKAKDQYQYILEHINPASNRAKERLKVL